MCKMNLSRRRALAGFLLAVSLAGCASTADDEVRKIRAQALYEQRLRRLSDKQVSLGLISLKEAVQLDPENPGYRNALGVLYLDLRKPAEAEAEFRKAIQLDPGYAEAEHNLGLAFSEQ